MDDLTGKISEILNDPQAMEQVNALAGMLGMSGNAPPSGTPAPKEPPPAATPLGALGNLGALGSLLGNNPPAAAPALDNDMAQTMMKILPLLGSIQQEDDNTRLLRALRPGTRLVLVGDADQLPSVGPGNVFSDLIRSGREERRHKLDEAAKIMQMLKLLPLLKSQGIL